MSVLRVGVGLRAAAEEKRQAALAEKAAFKAKIAAKRQTER